MREIISKYPIRSIAVRKTFVRLLDGCPDCGSFLDTGDKCMACGHDAAPLRAYEAPEGPEVDRNGRRRRRRKW